MRMGVEIPKQFLEIDGKPIFIHSLQAFDVHPLIDQMILVVNTQFRSEFEGVLGKYHFSKPLQITEGGAQRSDSSLNALKLIENKAEIKVLIHDGVRPFVNGELIESVVKALDSYKAVNVGLPITDTPLVVNAKNEIEKMPSRNLVFLAQTPQGFLADVIHLAYKKATADAEFTATDDCGVVHRYLPEISIGIVKGELSNKKITFPSDL